MVGCVGCGRGSEKPGAAGKRRPEDRRIMPNRRNVSDDPSAPRHEAQAGKGDGEEGEGRRFGNCRGVLRNDYPETVGYGPGTPGPPGPGL